VVRLAIELSEPDAFVLGSENDDLTYETYARHIALTKDIALRDLVPGPYYFQVLYPYVLALAHALFGEGLAPIAFLQLASLHAAAWLAGYLTFRLTERISSALVATGVVVASSQLVRQAGAFFPVGVFVSLALALGTVLTIRQPPGRSHLVLCTGWLAGVAAVYRSNFLILLPLSLAWIATSLGRSIRRRLQISDVFLLGAVLAFAPFTMRNWIVSGRLVLLTEGQFEANLYLVGLVPPDYDVGGGGNRAGNAARLVRFWREHPNRALELLKSKLGYVAGLRDDGSPLWWWAGSLAVGAIGFMLALGCGRAGSGVFLLAAFVAGQLGVLVLMRADHQRLYLPALPLLWILFVVGVTNVHARLGLRRFRPRGADDADLPVR
jgi:uncharacterized membrane protein